MEKKIMKKEFSSCLSITDNLEVVCKTCSSVFLNLILHACPLLGNSGRHFISSSHFPGFEKQWLNHTGNMRFTRWKIYSESVISLLHA